jgi:hypothetical protein
LSLWQLVHSVKKVDLVKDCNTEEERERVRERQKESELEKELEGTIENW